MTVEDVFTQNRRLWVRLRERAGCGRTPADHCISIRLRQHGAGELTGAAADRAEQRPLGIATQARRRPDRR